MSSGKLTSKTAIVSGGCMGLGAGIVKKFLSEGAKVLIFDLTDPPQSRDEEAGHRLAFYKGDVTKEEDWQKALDKCIEKFGGCDVCVNNAGVVHRAEPSTSVPKSEYDRIMTINITPLYHSARTLQPHFTARGGGVFVNISSISAPRPRPNLVWYAGSKGAVSSITRGLAAEFAPFKIRCNAILPVVAETGMVRSVLGGEDSVEGREGLLRAIPLGRICTPEDVGCAAAFLASEESSFITGVELPVDGGRSLM